MTLALILAEVEVILFLSLPVYTQHLNLIRNNVFLLLTLDFSK